MGKSSYSIVCFIDSLDNKEQLCVLCRDTFVVNVLLDCD